MTTPFDRFRQFLAELKWRKVYRWGATYLAVAFVMVQGAVPALLLPE